jgi:hypothetical protein
MKRILLCHNFIGITRLRRYLPKNFSFSRNDLDQNRSIYHFLFWYSALLILL